MSAGYLPSSPWSRKAGVSIVSSPACSAQCIEVRFLSIICVATAHVLLGTNDPEALEPLRQRYSGQHYALRKFYYECSNLKYLTGLINNHDLDRVRSGEFVDQSVGKHRKGAKHDWNILETFDLAFEFSGGDDILVDILV